MMLIEVLIELCSKVSERVGSLGLFVLSSFLPAIRLKVRQYSFFGQPRQSIDKFLPDPFPPC